MSADVPFFRAWLLVCLVYVGCLPIVQAQRPYIASTFPRDGARNLACNTFVHLSVTFPAEGRRVDPVTLSERSVFLTPAQKPRKKIAADLHFNPDMAYISLSPREPLRPETAYDLHITPYLVDERGMGFLPYKLRFHTGDCGQELPDAATEVPMAVTANKRLMPIQLALPEGAWRGDTAVLWGGLPAELPASVLSIERAQEPNRFVVQMQQPIDSSLDEWMWQDVETHWGWNRYRICLQSLEGDTVVCSPPQGLFRSHLALEKREYSLGDSLHFTAILPEKTSWVVVISNPGGEIVKRRVGMMYPDQEEILVSLDELEPGPYLALLRTKDRRLRQTIRIRL